MSFISYIKWLYIRKYGNIVRALTVYYLNYLSPKKYKYINVLNTKHRETHCLLYYFHFAYNSQQKILILWVKIFFKFYL